MMRVGSRPLHHPRMSLCLYRVLSFLRSGLLFVVVESSCLPVWPTRFQIPSIFLGLQTPGKPYGLALNKSKTLTSSTSEPIRQLWGHIFLKICSTVSKKKNQTFVFTCIFYWGRRHLQYLDDTDSSESTRGCALIRYRQMYSIYLFECFYYYHRWITWISFLINLFDVILFWSLVVRGCSCVSFCSLSLQRLCSKNKCLLFFFFFFTDISYTTHYLFFCCS